MESGRLRLSIKVAQDGGHSILVTGMVHEAGELVSRLSEMGLGARALGDIVIGSGSITWQKDGVSNEFGFACQHQSARDAASHALHRVSEVVRLCGIQPEIEDWLQQNSPAYLWR